MDRLRKLRRGRKRTLSRSARVLLWDSERYHPDMLLKFGRLTLVNRPPLVLCRLEASSQPEAGPGPRARKLSRWAPGVRRMIFFVSELRFPAGARSVSGAEAPGGAGRPLSRGSL